MDNLSVPIPSISPQPAVEPEVSTSSEFSNRRWILWSAIGLTFLIFGIAIGIFSAKFFSQSTTQPQISTYQDCLAAKGSLVQETYPATCVTVSGQRFVQPLTDEEKQGLQPPDLYREPTSSAATAHWKTYENLKWKFSVSYPSDELVSCQYDQVGDGIKLWAAPFDCPDGHDVFYEVSVLGYSRDKSPSYKQPIFSKNITVVGVQAIKNIYKYENEDGPLQALGGATEILVPSSDGMIQLIVLSDNPAKVQLFDQILSTFKFLDQN